MRLIRSFRRRTDAERKLLMEAALLLPAAALAIRVLPFPRTMRFGCVALRQHRAIPVEDISWAVRAAAKRMPFRALCFEQGLVVQRMLRRHGWPATLHYGIVPGQRLEAHVWVSIDKGLVHGGEEAPRFTEVGRWP